MMFKKIITLLILCGLCSCMDPRSKLDKACDRVLSKFARQMQKNNLYVAGTGGGCTSDGKIKLISITFDYLDCMTTEDARRLIVETTQNLIYLVNKNHSIQEHLVKHPEEINILDIGIISTIPNTYSNYIRCVSLLNGKLYYYTDNPQRPGPFIDAHKETFEEAVSILAQQSAHNPMISEQ